MYAPVVMRPGRSRALTRRCMEDPFACLWKQPQRTCRFTTPGAMPVMHAVRDGSEITDRGIRVDANRQDPGVGQCRGYAGWGSSAFGMKICVPAAGSPVTGEGALKRWLAAAEPARAMGAGLSPSAQNALQSSQRSFI